MSPRLANGGIQRRALFVAALVLFGSGCAGHAALTEQARTALDAGDTKTALDSLNKQLGVDKADQLPANTTGKNALLILDRSMVLQELREHKLSSRDLELADKQVELLDMKRSTVDDIGKYVFSDDTGPYKAPPYEKLYVNTMNMVNYLERHDLGGAKVEARRFSILQNYLEQSESVTPGMSALGAYLAGFAFEKAGDPSVALRYYDEALAYGDFQSLLEPVRRLTAGTTPQGEHVRAFLEKNPTAAVTEDASAPAPAEVLVIVSYGRVPAKVAKRVPIGLALTFGALYLSAGTSATANEIAAQGAVTWVNYPDLEEKQRVYGTPSFKADGAFHTLEAAPSIEGEVRAGYEKDKGRIMAAAITRTVTRFLAGQGARAAAQGASNDSTVGAIFSIVTQAALTAADTPDTRSWSTLPGRVALARLTLPPGQHTFELAAQGKKRAATVNLEPGGWAALTLTVLH